MCGDLRGLFPSFSGSFQVLANLLTSWAGGIEVVLGVPLDFRSATPAGRDFVSELAQSVCEFGLVNRRRVLLRLKEAPFLQCTILAIIPFSDVEDDHVRMQLWSDISINRTCRVMLKFGRDEPAGDFRGIIAADASKCVVFNLSQCNRHGIPVRLPDTVIASNKRS